MGALIVSDGGCTMPGDFSKAFGAGANVVMAGGVFSGFDESGAYGGVYSQQNHQVADSNSELH